MRNPSEVAFAILSLHWIATALRGAAEQGTPVSRLLHAVHDLTPMPAAFVLQGCGVYERGLSDILDDHEILHFARGAFANTGNEEITPQVNEEVDDFFWAWDAFFRAVLTLPEPSPEDLGRAFEDVEDLPYVLLREGPIAVRQVLEGWPQERPELAALRRTFLKSERRDDP